jgi:multidrug efflux pump subunit AcrA (membrane-fusion protein)
MNARRDRSRRPWLLFALALVAAGVIALAITEIGAPTSLARTSREVVTAEQGVVQSTVTGSGNIAAGTDVNVNFNTSGTLQDVYVHAGQRVKAGQLLADLDPTSAQLSLSQAEENLTAADDNLSCLRGVTSDCGSASSTSYTARASTVEYAAFHPGAGTTPKKPKTTTPTPTRTVTVTVPATTRAPTTPTTTTTTTPSPGSIASAQAAVYSAQAAVHTAETAVNNTKLYAPVGGTIASLSSLTPGDSVSGGSSGSSSGGSGSGSSSGNGSGSSTTAGSLGGSGSSGSGSSSSGSGSGFAEIINTGTLTMTVAFSESDISKVHVGQLATVTLDALAGVELAAHVSSISLVGTTSSSVVSYDATLTLDQNDARVKPGMSASASVIVGQAQGVTVPNQAVTGSGSLATVNMLKNGKTVSQQVVVGVRGDTRTQIISGLKEGDQLVITIALPSVGSTSPTGSGSGTLGRGLGGAGGLGGGAFGGGGGGAFLRRAVGGG